MRVVTVARKPCVGATVSNVTENQTGALNIEAARVSPSGRWPPNVILLHRRECEIIGERRVSTGTAVRERGGGKTIFSDTDKPKLKNMSYGDADGKETVPLWRCAQDCPVADLDRQSGRLKSGTGAIKKASSKDQKGNRASAFGSESRKEGTPVMCYGDVGGASRFFKQFKPGVKT